MDIGGHMQKVYLLIGIPRCGKSTFAKSLNDAVLVSVDDIRQKMSDDGIIGKEYSSDDNKIVFTEFHKKIFLHVKNGENVIVDATNARLCEREEIYTLLAQFKPKFIGVFFEINKQESMQRIAKLQQKGKTCVHYFNNPSEALDTYIDRLKNNMPTLNEPLSEIIFYKEGKIERIQQKILIASKNTGKIAIYRDVCENLGLKTTDLCQIKVDKEVEENGASETENAIIKAKTYHEITGLPVIANDSGLIIDKLAPEEQPGMFVRRYTGKELSDEEMIKIFIQKLNLVGGESDGHYNVALALIDYDGKLHCKNFTPKRHFINKPSKIVIKDQPLNSIEIDKTTGKYFSEMTVHEKNLSEREEMQKQQEFIKQVFLKSNT